MKNGGKEMDSLNYPSPPYQKAFTLIELLVVVAILVVLVGLRLPAFAGARVKSKSAQCLNNNRQLSAVWVMYAGDNHDYFVYSSDDGTGTAPYRSADATVGHNGDNYAWSWAHMDFSPNNSYNTDTAADIMLRPMWNYNKNANIYKCPADTSALLVNGAAVPRIRSYSMNFFLGGYGGGSLAIPVGYGVYAKLADLADTVRSPGAANTFLFIEERSDLINWGNFVTDMTGYPTKTSPANAAAYEWKLDMPAFYHNYASVVSFADGHCDIHRWQGDGTDNLPIVQGAFFGAHGGGTTFQVPRSADVAWMQKASVRPLR